MAGIYIHIPFCKSKCTYCDFFSKTDYKLQSELVNTLQNELKFRKNYLQNLPVSTIYFGGGTPSTLPVTDIQAILGTISDNFQVEPSAEITLEANPDDLNLDYLSGLHDIGINRLSIGIQSFDNDQLKTINRRHTSETAISAVKNGQKAGFDNISIDLIYGLPFQRIESWKEQLNIALSLDIQHISAYGLIYEKNTPLWNQLQSGQVSQTDDDTMIDMYSYLIETCARNGFEQYEISNFARNNCFSRHNSAYWKQEPYLGIGPSAHSYDGNSRQWNVPFLRAYCNGVNSNGSYFEMEKLTEEEKFNDFIMVSLRTSKGLDLEMLKEQFGEKMLEYILKMSNKYLLTDKLYKDDHFLRLTLEGIIISDLIIADLMKV